MYNRMFTLDDIRALGLCKDPTEVQGVDEGWTGTAQDILSAEQVKPEDRLWVVLRLDIPRRVKLEFAWGAATQVRHLMLDERSAHALDVLRAWIDGKATAGELRQAGARAKKASQAARAVETATLALQQESAVNTAAMMALAASQAAAMAAEAAALASETAAWTWGSAVRAEIWAVSEVATWAVVDAALASQKATWAGGRAARDARKTQIRYLRTLLNAYTAELAD